MSEEFYVGYQKKAPPGIARFVRVRVIGILGVALLVGVVIAFAQRQFTRGTWAYGQPREFIGKLYNHPVASLEVAGEGGGVDRCLLVSEGKFGFDAQDHAGKVVSIQGTLVSNDGRKMIEVISMQPLPDFVATASPDWKSLGEQEVVGEIVDSKCYLGVMNPGHLKTHKSCAIRCISGGIPPVLLVRQTDGSVEYLILTGPDGQAINQEVLPFVAEPVRIRGEVLDLGSYRWMKTDVAHIQRL